MTIAIAGISGFVGNELKTFFEQQDIKVIALNREDYFKINQLAKKLDNVDVVINLAGASILARWSEEYKQLLYDSRINTTHALVEAINQSGKPSLLISTSAVGIYTNDRVQTEEDAVYADDTLATICKDWEKEALNAKCRTVIYRFGVVLGKNGGAFAKMLTPFKLGVGGNIGNGQQPFPFIHIEDLKHAFDFAIKRHTLSGVYNLTAPNITTNAGLTQALGKALHRPTIFPVPQFVLNLIFGEGAKVLTQGQQVLPKRLLDEEFSFQYPDINSAVQSLV